MSYPDVNVNHNWAYDMPVGVGAPSCDFGGFSYDLPAGTCIDPWGRVIREAAPAPVDETSQVAAVPEASVPAAVEENITVARGLRGFIARLRRSKTDTHATTQELERIAQ